MAKTAQIDQYLKSKKVTADTKITLALLIELLDGFKTSTPKWVRADERLPEQATGKEIHIRYKGRALVGKTIAFKFAFREGTLHYKDILGEEDYPFIEWLDETPGNVSPQATENMEAAYLTIDPKYRTSEFRSGFENGWKERGYPAPLSPVVKEEHKLICSLDAQQCQQECEHKSDRTKCPFINLIKNQDKEVKEALGVACNLLEKCIDELRNSELTSLINNFLKGYGSAPSLPLVDLNKMAEEYAELFANTIYLPDTKEWKDCKTYFISGYTARTK